MRPRTTALIARSLLTLAALLISVTPGFADVAEPSDYRMDRYRAPVPATIEGGIVVGPQEAFELWESGDVAFIDVFPQAPKPANLPEGTIWRDKPRDSIPGAIWLPNVGYGAIADVTADYFRQGIESVIGGDNTNSLLFFCLEDCWMSWNAAKRAIEWGHTSVYWFPEGTDGWALWDYIRLSGSSRSQGSPKHNELPLLVAYQLFLGVTDCAIGVG